MAAALTALAPFMVYYSAEARGYGRDDGAGHALDPGDAGGRGRPALGWWVAVRGGVLRAVYTHYTGVFVLAAQLLWLLWAHPEARRPA